MRLGLLALLLSQTPCRPPMPAGEPPEPGCRPMFQAAAKDGLGPCEWVCVCDGAILRPFTPRAYVPGCEAKR